MPIEPVYNDKTVIDPWDEEFRNDLIFTLMVQDGIEPDAVNEEVVMRYSYLADVALAYVEKKMHTFVKNQAANPGYRVHPSNSNIEVTPLPFDRATKVLKDGFYGFWSEFWP